jgi:UrcA family protein
MIVRLNNQINSQTKGFTPHRETAMNNLTILAATALTAYASCPSAWADSNLEPRSVTVHYEDLNTNSAHGAASLYQRIKFAAETVCSDLGPSRSLALQSRYASCVQGAIGVAVTHVNRPAVTEYAVARGIFPADPQIKGKFARNN